YGMENYEQERVGEIIQRIYKLVSKNYKVSEFNTPVSEILSGIAVVMVVLYGGHEVIAGNNTAGALFSFIGAFILAYDPIKRLGRLNSTMQTGLACAERVFAVLDTPPEISNKFDAQPLKIAQPAITFD